MNEGQILTPKEREYMFPTQQRMTEQRLEQFQVEGTLLDCNYNPEPGVSERIEGSVAGNNGERQQVVIDKLSTGFRATIDGKPTSPDEAKSLYRRYEDFVMLKGAGVNDNLHIQEERKAFEKRKAENAEMEKN